MNFHILILLALTDFVLSEDSELSKHEKLHPTVITKTPEDVKAKWMQENYHTFENSQHLHRFDDKRKHHHGSYSNRYHKHEHNAASHPGQDSNFNSHSPRHYHGRKWEN